MKRVLGLALTTLLILPLAACKTEPPQENLQELIAKHLADADAQLINSKLDEADKLYDWVLEKEPNNVAALTGKGRVALARETPADAIAPLEKAVAAKGDDALARTSLGRAYAGTKDWAKAAEQLGKAWEIDKNDDQVGLEYGIALRENGQHDEAITTLEAVAENNPKIKFVYRELAKAHHAKPDLDKALRTYMKAQSTWPGDQDSFAGAAQVYEAQGKISKSIDQWAQYIQQDCCSTYSKEVAQPKLKELKEKENTGVTDASAEGGGAVEGEDEAAN